MHAARNRIKSLEKPMRSQPHQGKSNENRNGLVRDFRAKIRQNLRQENRKSALMQSSRNRRHHIFGNFKIKKEIRKHRARDAQNHQHTKELRQAINLVKISPPSGNPSAHANHHVYRSVIERRGIGKTSDKVREEPDNRPRTKAPNHSNDNRAHAIHV